MCSHTDRSVPIHTCTDTPTECSHTDIGVYTCTTHTHMHRHPYIHTSTRRWKICTYTIKKGKKNQFKVTLGHRELDANLASCACVKNKQNHIKDFSVIDRSTEQPRGWAFLTATHPQCPKPLGKRAILSQSNYNQARLTSDISLYKWLGPHTSRLCRTGLLSFPFSWWVIWTSAVSMGIQKSSPQNDSVELYFYYYKFK